MSKTDATESAAFAARRAAEDLAALFPALMVEADRVAHGVAAGLHGRRRAGPGETFWQHRAYVFGDPVGAIDWRQSARVADRLLVRQNEWEAAATVWLWRDASPSFDYASAPSLPTKRRRAEILAAALAILLSQAGERVGLLGLERRPFHGRSAPALILAALLAEGSKGPSAPPAADLAPGARAVLFSDFFAEPTAIRSPVATYAAAGARGVLVQVVDPAEEDFPFSGRIQFQDVEGKAALLFGEARSAGAAYRRKFQAHRGLLVEIAERFGWTFLAHRTDKPPQTALLALFLALADAKTMQR